MRCRAKGKSPGLIVKSRNRRDRWVYESNREISKSTGQRSPPLGSIVDWLLYLSLLSSSSLSSYTQTPPQRHAEEGTETEQETQSIRPGGSCRACR